MVSKIVYIINKKFIIVFKLISNQDFNYLLHYILN